MPQKVIKFKGINRAINEFQTSGECEELINLRAHADGALHVVKPKHVMVKNTRYCKIYEHSWGDVNNLIVVDRSSAHVKWIDESGTIKGDLGYFYSEDIEITHAGNILVIYVESRKLQKVFKFEDGKYSEYRIGFRQIVDAQITYGTGYFSAPSNSAEAFDKTASSLNEAMQKAASGFYSSYTNGLCGASVIGCTYELEDGSEIWSTAFVVANSMLAYGHEAPTVDSTNKTVKVTGANNVKLELKFDNKKPSGVKSVNVYSTKPVFQYEIVARTTPEDIEIRQMSLDDLNLSGQLMYYQGSVSLDKTYVQVQLRFGADIAGEKIMDVTTGCTDRTGNAVSYNNRFHYYKSEVNHIIQPPTISRAPSTWDPDEITVSNWVAYVKFDKSWKLIDNIYRLVDDSKLDIIYPMIGVEKIAFVKADTNGTQITSVPYSEMFYVDLKESSAYNYSYAFEFTPNIISGASFKSEVEADGQLWSNAFEYDKKVFWKKEYNAINVSAQYNPFVFPVEYSYHFGGEIRDIVTAYTPVSSTQIGQFPITVFTSNGIYALEQESTQVLYSNILPLQPLVIDDKAVSTPNGTFFKSSSNLYALTGRDVLDVSAALHGSRELRIRENPSYKALCENGSTGTQFIDFGFKLSYIDFDDFLKDAILSYDVLHNEVYINSGHTNRGYAYVYNINTNSFHKVSTRYNLAKNCGRYAIKKLEDGSSFEIVDMHTEVATTQPILLQSRPMSLEALYTHIQRAILLTDTHLSGNQHLCLSVFGSDNLYDWKCIISAQKQNVALRHIRTNKAAKSYRDYVILISGYVSTDTDISDLIADYTVVQRRLG